MIRIIVGVTFLAIYLILSYLVFPFLGIMEKTSSVSEQCNGASDKF